MAGGDARRHQWRDGCCQNLDGTGLRQKFCNGCVQLSQCQKLAGTAMRIMQRQRSVGSRRTRRLVVGSSAVGNSRAAGVMVLAVIVIRVRVVPRTFAQVAVNGQRNRAAIAVLMVRMIVRHPSQVRRQQVAGQDAQSKSALPSLHFEPSKNTVEITRGRILTDKTTQASRNVLDFTQSSPMGESLRRWRCSAASTALT